MKMMVMRVNTNYT